MTSRALLTALVALILVGLYVGRGAASEGELERLVRAEHRVGRLEAENRKLWRAFRAQQRGRWREKRKRRSVEQRLHQLAASRIGSIHRIIEVGAAAYGQSYPTLLRKARCESGLWPFARNNGSKDSPMGLFQFRPSTWSSTPFGRFSIWDPWAQALAAAWMHDAGRGGEWACR